MATINKKELINRLYEYDMFETKKQAGEFLEDFVDMIKTEVTNSNSISIPGFGKFENFTRENGTKTPKFRAFKTFKDAVKA